MKNAVLAIHGVAGDKANHYPRHACARNGGLQTACHICHQSGFRRVAGTHTHLTKLARTDTAALFQQEAA